MMRAQAWGLLALGLVACGPSGRGDGSPGAHIEITPADLQVTITNGAAVVQPYKAMLVDPLGGHQDITGEVTFAVADPGFGVWAGPSLTINGGAAGPTKVVATDGSGDKGDTSLTVFIKGTRTDGSAPANADMLFDGATETPGRAPTIAYPTDGILVPPNLGAFDVHWTDSAGNDLYQIKLANTYVDLRIYTTNPAPAYTSYTPAEWTSVASTHERIALTVAGMSQASPSQKGTAAPEHIDVTNETVAGGVYYWTTEPAQGVNRYDMSTPSMPPSAFFPTGTQPTTCIGCHGLSHDGTKMALTLDSGDGRGTILNVGDRSVLVPYDTNSQYWNFATFNADASKLVTVSHGQMVLRDTNGGAVLANIPNTGSMLATHPELSPDGTKLANVETSTDYYDFQVSDGSIVVRSADTGSNTFGAIQTLVPNVSGASNYYPSWSPDGQWLLFTRTTGNSYSDTSAEIWVVKADGTGQPIQLALADGIATGVTNSWARWTPFPQTFGPNNEQVFYVTFSSQRAFGVRPLTTSSWGTNPQIWMAPFFPDKAIAGLDPTGPAFRMPFQDLATGNHIAQWTEAVVIAINPDGSPLTQAEAVRTGRLR